MKYILAILLSGLLITGCVIKRDLDIELTQQERVFYDSLNHQEIAIDSIKRYISEYIHGEDKGYSEYYIYIYISGDAFKKTSLFEQAYSIAEFVANVQIEKIKVKYFDILYFHNEIPRAHIYFDIDNNSYRLNREDISDLAD